MKYCDKCKKPAFDNQNYCQSCRNNKFVKTLEDFEKRQIKEQNKEQLKQSFEDNKKFATKQAVKAKNLILEKAVPTVKDEFSKTVNKVSDIAGSGTKEEKAKNIFAYIKEFFTVRFVKFIKNYKRFKELPKQSKIKHFCFPIVIVLIIAVCLHSGGGAAKGLTNDEATAVLACSMLSSDMQSAAQYGAVNPVYFGTLSKVYTITDTEKAKDDDGNYKITVYIDYKMFGGGDTSGTLIFKYDKDTNRAKLTGGTAVNGLQTWATYYAAN